MTPQLVAKHRLEPYLDPPYPEIPQLQEKACLLSSLGPYF